LSKPTPQAFAKLHSVASLVGVMGQKSLSTVLHGLKTWRDYWWINRERIVILAFVNTLVTFTYEAIVRSLLAPMMIESASYHFLVITETGGWMINQQSLNNVFMTIFASLMGGPVYFIKSRFNRFLFFGGFGCFNSVLSQCVTSIIRFGGIQIFVARLTFDLIYNGTLKYFIFELGRKKLANPKTSIKGLGAVRITQDFSTTCMRVGLLNFFGFRG